MTDAKPKKGLPVAAIIVLGIVAVCCLTSVAGGAIGYSSFQEYVVRSKTSEAQANLRNLFQLSAGYYANEQWGAGSVAAGGSAVSACTVGPARTSNVPSSSKTVVDWMSEAESFSALGFSVADPIYYQYEIAGPPGRCDNAPSTELYSLRAHGDLDADGEASLFELTVRSDVNNELERSPGFHVQNELE